MDHSLLLKVTRQQKKSWIKFNQTMYQQETETNKILLHKTFHQYNMHPVDSIVRCINLFSFNWDVIVATRDFSCISTRKNCKVCKVWLVGGHLYEKSMF